MASIDAAHGPASLPHASPTLASRLHQRLACLEDRVRDGADAGLTHLLAPMRERLTLLERMVGRLGVHLEGPIVGPVGREAEASCVMCPAAARCRQWLDSPDAPDAYREFCPNATLFRALMQPDERAPSVPPADHDARRPRRARQPADTGHPSADELREMRLEAARRNARALIEMAYFP